MSYSHLPMKMKFHCYSEMFIYLFKFKTFGYVITHTLRALGPQERDLRLGSKNTHTHNTRDLEPRPLLTICNPILQSSARYTSSDKLDVGTFCSN